MIQRPSDPDRLTVMHVTTGMEVGGGEVLLLNLVERATALGRRSIVVSLIEDGPMRRRFEAAGVTVHGLGMRRGVPSPAGLVRLVALIRRERPDVVQGWLYHGLIAATVALTLSGRRRRTRLIHGIYGSSIDFSAYPPRVRLGFRLAAVMSRCADGAIYNTAAGIAYHQAQGFAVAAARIIENGIDAARFEAVRGIREQVRAELGLRPDEVAVISIARVDPMKGWDRLLRVTERIDGIRLLALGHGTEAFAAHPSRLLLGTRDDVPRLLAAADVFVLASRFGEGTSVALTEAMAAGLPVVVTDVGDNARIAGGGGRIVGAEDESGLERALRELSADPARRRELGAAARRRVSETCSIDHSVDAYYRLYAGLTA
jgi:glycosyltransferase involved in cell wall biosynthesis